MRIVSQNKIVDVLYEAVNIVNSLDGNSNHIIFSCPIYLEFDNHKNWLRLGIYNDNDEAVSVLEKLHEAYVNGNKIFYMP